jgi:hypothetical protein
MAYSCPSGMILICDGAMSQRKEGFDVIRITWFSIAISAEILGLGVGVARGCEMTCFGVSDEARRQAAEIRFNQLFNRFNPAAVEVALFQAAEQMYQRKHYPQAAEVYRRLLASANERRRKQALDRLWEIATYWLQDTWEAREPLKHFDQLHWLDWVYPYRWLRDGWDALKERIPFEPPDWLDWVCPFDVPSLFDILPDPRTLFTRALFCRNFLHWNDSKPLLNEEGRSAELLQCVHDSEPAGPLADKSLFLLGYLAWMHEDFRRGDECFSLLEKNHPNSPFHPWAIELAVKSKLMSYDEKEGRKPIEEARRLIDKAQKLSGLSEDRKSDLRSLLSSVFAQLSELDFKEADKCYLACRLDEARLRYQRICQDYPNTPTADRAKERLKKMKKGNY